MPTVRRLPSYLRFLKVLQAREREYVSCTHIAAELGLDPTQIRKDLALAGAAGTPKIGYQVDKLIEAIESFLGWNNTTNAFILGAGSVAETLIASNTLQQQCGLDILAVFDSDPKLAGKELAGKEVQPVDKMADLAHRMHVHIGILTVPSQNAQEAADQLIAAGVNALWNFTYENITVPDDVTLENVDIAGSMAALSAKRFAAEMVKS